MSPEAQKFYKPRISQAWEIFIYSFTTSIDLLKFAIFWIPGVDLADWVLWFIAYLPLNIIFFINLGFGYLSGKKSGSKIATTLSTTVVGLVPVLDGLIPELTIEAYGILRAIRQEDYLAAEEAAANAAMQAQEAQMREMQYEQYMQQRALNQAQQDEEEEMDYERIEHEMKAAQANDNSDEEESFDEYAQAA